MAEQSRKQKSQSDAEKQREKGKEYAEAGKGEKILLVLLKVLLLFSVGMQMFLSVYAIYINGSFSPSYYSLVFYGNLLNMGLIVLLLVYLFLAFFVWNQQERLFRKIKGYLCPENFLFAAFLIWMYVSGLHYMTENPNALRTNEVPYTNAIMKFLLCFLLAQYLNGDRKKLHILFNIYVILLTVFGVYVLAKLLSQNEFSLLSGGSVFFSGGAVKRLGINCNPNTTGLYAKTVLMLCVYLFVAEKRKFRWLYLVFAVVHYMLLTLTFSRGAIVSGGVGVSAIVMLAVWRGLRKRGILSRVLISIGTFAAVFFLFLTIREPVMGIYNFFRQEYAGQEKVVLREMNLHSSGRMALYKAAIQSMQDPENALFGATPKGVCALLSETMGREVNMYTHNEFLEIMCATGILGLLLFLAWVVCIARKGWIICYDGGSVFSMSEGALAIVCFAEITNNMLEAMLTFHTLCLSGMIFYIAAGYIVKDERKRYDAVG